MNSSPLIQQNITYCPIFKGFPSCTSSTFFIKNSDLHCAITHYFETEKYMYVIHTCLKLHRLLFSIFETSGIDWMQLSNENDFLDQMLGQPPAHPCERSGGPRPKCGRKPRTWAAVATGGFVAREVSGRGPIRAGIDAQLAALATQSGRPTWRLTTSLPRGGGSRQEAAQDRSRTASLGRLDAAIPLVVHAMRFWRSFGENSA